MKTYQSNKPRGFTLVELLVVITIIAVLVALSVVGFFRFRNSADIATTTSNMRQLQTANASYAADNNGKFIPLFANEADSGEKTFQWFESPEFAGLLTGDTTMYVDGKKVRELPLSVLDPKVVRAKARHYKLLSANYGYNAEKMPNGGWSTPGAEPAFRASQLTDPARTFAFITATDWIAQYGGRFKWQGDKAVEGKTTDGKIAFRHNDKAVAAFYDGHVETFTMDKLREIDKKGGNNNIFWYGGAK